MTRTPPIRALTAAVVCLLVLLAAAPAASASTFIVTRTDDPVPGTCDVGDCSLREAIIAANTTSGPDVIVLAGGGAIYTLTQGVADLLPEDLTAASGDLDITESLVINGNGSIVEAGAGLNDRVFHIAGAAVDVTINDLTIRNGAVGGFLSFGGGLYVRDASLTLNHCVVTTNSTLSESSSRDDGGGIAAVGTYAAGGMVTLAHLTLDNTTVSANTGLGGGGLVCALCALAIQNNSSVVSNTAAGGDGGGILVVGDASTVSITKTAITGNAAARGGGIAIPVGDSAPTLFSNRIASNTATTGGAMFSGTAVVNAANNWWGCNAGPGATAAGCPVAPNSVSGPVTADPHLVLNASATPSTISRNTNATAAADLRFNNSDMNPAGVVPDTTSVAFGGGPGSFAQPSVTTSNGVATNDFTGTVSGAASLTAALDGQTVAFTVVVNSPPTASQINAQSIDEDTSTGALAFTIADEDGNPLSVAASATTNPSLIDSIVLGGSGGSRTITVTPVANRPFASPSEAATITVEVSDGFAITPMSFVLTVNAVNDAPTLDPIAGPPPIAEDSGVQTVNLSGIAAGAGETQTITVTATSDKPLLIPNPTVTYASPGGTGSLSYQPIANAFGTAVITVTVKDDGGTAGVGVDTFVRTFTVQVDPAADTPSVTGATTREDTQTTSGLVVTRNADDGDEVTHVKVTNLVNGTLFKNDGATQIPSGTFIAYAEANAGLRFTPSADFFGTASFDLQASTSAADAGLGGAIVTATITVTGTADTPSVTGATTVAQVRTTSGLVISRNVLDGPEVTHFKITNIQHGTLFQHNAADQIVNGSFITGAQGGAGLTFTPADGFTGMASFDVQASISAVDAGLGGGVATAAITVDPHATTTTIGTWGPSPSDQTQMVSVHYVVESADGGPAPTGTVTVTMSGGSETCTGTVADGFCMLTPMLAGSRTITATYNGNAINAGSVSAPVSTTINACSISPVVTSTLDNGSVGTLRDAVANGCAGNVITFDIPGPGPHTVVLGGSPIVLHKNVTILGAADGTAISGNDASGIVVVSPTLTVTLDRLTLTHGSAATGGAVVHNGTSLTISNSTLTGNTASVSGGAIWNSGPATTLRVVNSTISGNTAGTGPGVGIGGGIDSRGGAVLLTHATVTANTAGESAGGVAHAGVAFLMNSIVAGNTAGTHSDITPGYLPAGGNVVGGDPRLGPLQNNGGPTFTHVPLQDSPALDAGDATFTVDAELTTDQRGLARVRDAADADTVQTVDIGAVEADPVVEIVHDKTMAEDGSIQFTFNVGDDTTPFDTFTVVSGNTTLLPNTAGHVDVTASSGSRTVTLTPVPNGFGTSVITITATKNLGGVPQTSQTSFTLTVNGVDDPPTLDPIVNPPAIAEDSLQQTVTLTGISDGGGEGQVLTVTAVSDNPALIPNPTVTYASPNATATLAYTPAANQSGTTGISVFVSDGVTQVERRFTVTVTPLGDTPRVEPNPVHVLEDGTAAVFLRRGLDEGSDNYIFFKITGITGGTMLSGQGPTHDGDFISEPMGVLGMFFTPTPNSTVTGHYTVQASASETDHPSDAGLGGLPVVVDIIVDSVPDEPAITPATTAEDTQTTSGLVITRNAVDGPDVTHFKILSIEHGLLFQHDGVTPIHVNDMITAAQAGAGLRFTPEPGFSGTASFTTIGVLDAAGFVNGTPAVATAVINVTPVADTPSITNATTTVNTQTTSGLVISRNAADGSEVGFVKITGISGGTLFQSDGTTPIGNGAFITMAQGAAGLRFTPLTDSVAMGHFTIQASLSAGDAGLGGSQVIAAIVVNRVVSTVTVTTSGSPSLPGQAVTFTATVTPALAAASGYVIFADGVTTLGPPVTLVGGTASFTTSTLTLGLHQISAAYGGNDLALPATANLPGGQLVGGGRTIITGAGETGGPHVRRFTAIDGTAPSTGPLDSFFAFDPSFTGGARVAEADLNGDGEPDYIVGAGPGGGPDVRVFDGATGALTRSFLVFEPGFHGGVYVAAGDVDGNGLADIIVGSGTGRIGEVRVFSGLDGSLLGDVLVFPPTFIGGVRVGAGDVNGDGRADLIVGSGPGMGAEVIVLDALTGATLRTLHPYSGYPNGVFVAAGDVTGDGYADIVTGADSGGGPHVMVFDGLTGATKMSFFAFDPAFTGGVRVAVGDVNGDRHADVIVGSGPGMHATVRVFDAVTGAMVNEVEPYGAYANSLFVATRAPLNRMSLDLPAVASTVSGPFAVGGWALMENPTDAGVAAIHMWAVPVTGGAPTFLGLATLGFTRPDVAALFGAQYVHAGYNLTAPALPPGVYDIAAAAQSSVTGTFQVMRVVRVTVIP